MLEDYFEEKIKKDTLQEQKVQITESVSEVERQLSALGTLSEHSSELLEQHKPYYTQDILTRDMAQSLIKEVRIHSEKELEIIWKFSECYSQLEQGFMPNLNI